MVTIEIEREADADGLRFYYSIRRDGRLLCGSLKHWEDADQAEEAARREAADLVVNVDEVLQVNARQ